MKLFSPLFGRFQDGVDPFEQITFCLGGEHIGGEAHTGFEILDIIVLAKHRDAGGDVTGW